MEYTRGGPLPPAELDACREEGVLVWADHQGRYWTVDRIEDDHLLNIELHLMGRSSFRLPEQYNPDNPRWQRTYQIIIDEIERRGLQLKEATGVPPVFDEEDYERR